MRCGEVCFNIKKADFLMFYLVNRFDKRADEFGAGLDSFLNPTLRCNSFLTTAPSIEVRAYVSYFFKSAMSETLCDIWFLFELE